MQVEIDYNKTVSNQDISLVPYAKSFNFVKILFLVTNFKKSCQPS